MGENLQCKVSFYNGPVCKGAFIAIPLHLCYARVVSTPSEIQSPFVQRHNVGLHFALILFGMTFCGLLFGRILISLGVVSMVTRELIVVPVSYVSFFFLIKLWLELVPPHEVATRSVNKRITPKPSRHNRFIDVLGDALPFEFEGLIVLIILIFVFIALVFFVYWLATEGPVLLTDAAFETFLSASLIRASAKIQRGDWVRKVFFKTIGWFLLIYAVGFYSLHALSDHCPNFIRASEAISGCLLHSVFNP